MSKILLVAGIAIVVVLIAVLIRIVLGPLFEPAARFSSPVDNFHEAGFSELSGFISENFSSNNIKQDNGYWAQIGITSHHLPTALLFIADFYKNLVNSKGPRDVFVIVGPDHFEGCHAPVSITTRPYLNSFGKLYPDELIINELLAAGVYKGDGCFKNEHSIGVQTIFIKYLFPEAKIVPLIFSATAEDKIINNIVDVLAKHKDKITVIVSADFSHYQTYSRATQLDQISEKMIKDLDGANFSLEYVDSPASMKLAILLAKKIGSDKAVILKRANSFDFTEQTENTTGYINTVFVNSEKSDNLINLIFTGDIMLSRSVGNKMKTENNYQWPFLKIANYLKKADLVFGNLESPISNRGIKVGSIYSFRADPEVVDGLKFAGFNYLSVANNHIGDYNRVAMEDTFKILKENKINYVGGGFSEAEANNPVIAEIKGVKIALLAYTALGARYTEAKRENSGIAWLNQEKMVESIEKAREKSDFVIVSVHFGEEYQKNSNSFQKNIAHIAIDSGASLIIGHHPHVVQEIEQYKNGYIAYSLGNFVFDQLFSEDTMAGLILEVILNNKKEIEIEQIKIKITKDFQVELME